MAVNTDRGRILSFPANLIQVPTHGGDLGSLGVLESQITIPFEIKRVYFIYEVPATSSRGSHGHKNLQQLIIPVAGSFDVVLDDGVEEKTFSLTSPSLGLHLKPGLWRNLINFSNGAVCMVLASEHFDESDYIRDYEEFLAWARK